MNIARGLLRLWIVLTGIWLVLVGLFHYDDLVDPYVTPQGFYFLKDVSKALAQAELDRRQVTAPAKGWGTFEISTPDGFVYTMAGADGSDAYNRLTAAMESMPFAQDPVSVERYTEAYHALEDGTVKGTTEQIEIGGLPGTFLFVGRSVPEAEKTRQAKEAYKIGSGVRNVVVGQKRKLALQSAALFGVVPPALLFVLGWLVLWIARGFRAAR